MAGEQIQGEDSRATITPIYCYAIRHAESSAESLYLTSYADPIMISGLPAEWDADAIQEFIPAQIGHGVLEKRDGIDKLTFDVQCRLAVAQSLSRYTLFGAIPKITIDVIRVIPGPAAAGVAAVYNRDTYTSASGVIVEFGVEGSIMNARCCPEPFVTGHQVPRWRFTRTCNRVLYAPDCGVDRELYKLEGLIVSMDYAGRTAVISGQRPLPDAEDFFRQGVLLHAASGTRHSIFKSEYQASDTRVFLTQWFPDFAIGDVVTLYAGCRHTIDDCKNKFANLANFGGCPDIPNVNPAIHGVS